MRDGILALAVETSCDETAVAILRGRDRLLASEIASQVALHREFGGVVPEVASRNHLVKIKPLIGAALKRAGEAISDLDCIAATRGPGLLTSLLVGYSVAKGLAIGLRKPFIGVNHLEGHLLSPFFGEPGGPTPSVGLIVSGGHTMLIQLEGVGAYRVLGQTLDDAAGEAFDKVAKLLALGYPGGPILDRLARCGNPHAVDFGRVRMKGNPLDFSFSGLKTAVLYRVRGTSLQAEAEQRRIWRESAGRATTEETLSHCSQATLDLIASFQNAVVADLVERTLAAADTCRVRSVFVSGGVACNSLLRERFREAARQTGLQALFPSPALSTDNAAMIAAAGYYKLMAGQHADSSFTAHASLPLGRSNR